MYRKGTYEVGSRQAQQGRNSAEASVYNDAGNEDGSDEEETQPEGSAATDEEKSEQHQEGADDKPMSLGRATGLAKLPSALEWLRCALLLATSSAFLLQHLEFRTIFDKRWVPWIRLTTPCAVLHDSCEAVSQHLVAFWGCDMLSQCPGMSFEFVYMQACARRCQEGHARRRQRG